MTTPRDQPLAGWRSPAAPPGLRERALAAARDPAVTPLPRRIEDCIWESRTIRLAWLAAAVVLGVLNLTVQDRGAAPAASVTAMAEAPAIESEVGIEIPPPSDDRMTLAEAYRLAVALLNDPCLDPWSGEDCT